MADDQGNTSTTTDAPPAGTTGTTTAPDTGAPPVSAEEAAKALTAAQAEAEKFKGLARKHEDRAKENAEKAKKFDEAQAANASEQEKAVKAAVEDTEKSVASKFLARIAASEVKAAAGGRLADPSDAVRLLDVSGFVNDEGEANSAAITKAIDELLVAKPYLAPTGVKPPPVSLDGGTRTSTTVGSTNVAPGMDRMRAAYGETPARR